MLKILQSHIGVPEFKSRLHLSFQLQGNMYNGNQQVKVQVLAPLPSMWEMGLSARSSVLAPEGRINIVLSIYASIYKSLN